MSKVLFISLLFAASIQFSMASGNTANRKVTVVRDCSGTYIRTGGNDFLVCNRELLDGVEDGAKIRMRYKKTTECPPRDEIVCMLFHPHKGTVEIIALK